MAQLNWVDYIILAIFFFSIISGLARGFIREVIALITLIAAFVMAILFSNSLATYLLNSSLLKGLVNQASQTGPDAASSVFYVTLAICFAGIFIVTMMIGSIVGYLLNSPFQWGILGLGNRLLGAVFGFCRGFLYTIVIIFLIQLTSFSTYSWWQQSQIVPMMKPYVSWLESIVSPNLANIKSRLGETMSTINSSLQNVTNH